MDWDEEAIKALYVEIGSRVRRARKEHDWNQLELADAVHLTRSSIANLEAGRQRPPIHVIWLIAHALGVTVDKLLPSGAELDKLVSMRSPEIDLDGQPDSTHDFVTSAIRRATGG